MFFPRNLHFFFKKIPLVRKTSSSVGQLLENDTVRSFLKEITSSDLQNQTINHLVKQRLQIENELQSLKSLEGEAELKKLVTEEKQKFTEAIHLINEQILTEFAPSYDENRDVIIEVTAGVGGKEAMHFAAELFQMYENYCLSKRWDWQMQQMDVPELGGMRHGSAFVTGRGASETLKLESGVHRVQRVPATEKSGRVHTSTVTVAVLPQPTDVEVVINDKDIKMETKTSSGPGGQHVNKTESCVRITHIPTGIVIENQTDRSQIQNRKIALQRLRSKLYQMEIDGYRSMTQSSRKEQVGSSLRSEKIRTYNFNQDRVTDHRVGVSLHNLRKFLEGGSDLDQLISQLSSHDRNQKILRLVEESMKNMKPR